MVRIEFFDKFGNLLRTEFWYGGVIPRRGDLLDFTEQPQGAVSGKVDLVEWLGDGEVRVFVV